MQPLLQVALKFLDEINKASIVMLDEAGIVPHPVAARIASGIAQVIARERQSPPQRSADYLDYEPGHGIVGPDASRCTGVIRTSHRHCAHEPAGLLLRNSSL
jgi:hypothetical protein